MIIGIALIIIGLVAIGIKTGIIEGTIWGWAWPLLLILIGLTFLVGRRRWGAWHCGPWREKDDQP